MRTFVSLGVMVLGFCAVSANAQETLPAVEVTATTTDGATVQQVCSDLKASQPPDCSMTTFPSAPGLPNAHGDGYFGNGCGADAFSSFAADLFLKAFQKGYSGDLNHPVTGDKAIDFTSACNHHDGCYSSPRLKSWCDSQLGIELNTVCQHADSTYAATCNSFATKYEDAVNAKGSEAFADDQADLKCSEWGNAMKDNGC